MPNNVREQLLPILQESIGLLASGEEVDRKALLAELEKVRAEALAQMATNRGVVTSFVSALNLLVDCFQRRVDVTRLRLAVEILDVTWGWNDGFPLELLRNGTAVKLPTDGSATGYTVINWNNFLTFYADELGYNRFDDREVEQLWNDLTIGYVRLPLADVHLADPRGASSTWVTDDGAGGKTLRLGDPQHDLYDAIGLAWLPPNSKTRAVLVSCRMQDRARAAGLLRCPTAVDGWGNLFFVPRHPHDQPWPNHGAATARPTSDDISLPEAIHGPANVGRASASLYPVPEFDVGDRFTTYGAEVMDRAIARLRNALT